MVWVKCSLRWEAENLEMFACWQCSLVRLIAMSALDEMKFFTGKGM